MYYIDTDTFDTRYWTRNIPLIRMQIKNINNTSMAEIVKPFILPVVRQRCVFFFFVKH